MSKDVILKNAGRNWARGAADPDAVMKPTGKVGRPNPELMPLSKKLNKRADVTNPEIMKPSFVKGAFVGGNTKRRARARHDAAIRARRNVTIRGAFVGEEERMLAAEGGACERAALQRRSGLSR
jgi:hypothetical protein